MYNTKLTGVITWREYYIRNNLVFLSERVPSGDSEKWLDPTSTGIDILTTALWRTEIWLLTNTGIRISDVLMLLQPSGTTFFSLTIQIGYIILGQYTISFQTKELIAHSPTMNPLQNVWGMIGGIVAGRLSETIQNFENSLLNKQESWLVGKIKANCPFWDLAP